MEHGTKPVYTGNLVEIFAVTPRLYFRKADLMTRGQCNGAFLVGGSGAGSGAGTGVVGVVDVPTMEGAHEIMEESQRLFGQPVKFIFITHGHDDHLEGLPLFLDQDVTIFCPERLVDRVARADGPVSAPRAVVVGVRERTRVSLAGLEVECRVMDGTAHSASDMVVRVPEAGCVCTGDTVVDFSLLHFHHADVENWVTSLRSLASLPDQKVLPGHGGIYPFSKVSECADFIETLLRAAQRCLSALTREEIVAISESHINEIVSAFFQGSDPDAATIRELAGVGATRELRMVLRNLLYRELR
jgi:glyoxylase-like metal-dependent hydrolase (beta-lactamase superfamily II)